MSPHAYTEDRLVEQPAIALFAELGWQTMSAMDEVFETSGTLGREMSGEVVLVPRLRQAVAEATAYCKAQGVDLARIEGTSAEKFERAQAVEDGADQLLAPEAVKRDFLARARLVEALYGAVKPDPVAVEFARRCGSIRALADYIRNRSEPPDISHVMQGIQELLDGSIASEPFTIKEHASTYPAIDLSKID